MYHLYLLSAEMQEPMKPALQPRAIGYDNQHGRANTRSTPHSISADANALGYRPIGNQYSEQVA